MCTLGSADPRLKGTSFSERLLLLSPVMHWGVLINTNGWYGYEELKSACPTRVLNATNFATRLCSSHADLESPFTHQKPNPSPHNLQRSQVPAGFKEISKS